MYTSANQGYQYARSNFSHYQWCLVLIAFVVVLYPIMGFIALVRNGDNPYSDLSKSELALKNDNVGRFYWILRWALNWCLLFLIIYYLAIASVFIYIKKMQSFPG